MEDILCKTCAAWVDCGLKDDKPYGFCLMCDLFTYTAATTCPNHVDGEPIPEKEYERGVCE